MKLIYNSVPYDRDNMDGLLNVLNISIGTICVHVTHSVYVNNVLHSEKSPARPMLIYSTNY